MMNLQCDLIRHKFSGNFSALSGVAIVLSPLEFPSKRTLKLLRISLFNCIYNSLKAISSTLRMQRYDPSVIVFILFTNPLEKI